jgi:hypothetical protein
VTIDLDSKNIFTKCESKSALINVMKQETVCKKKRVSRNEVQVKRASWFGKIHLTITITEQ